MAKDKQSTQFPKRVMLVIHSMRGGGSERQMSYLANEIAARSETSLLTLDDAMGDHYSLDPRIERIGLNLASDRGGLLRGFVANVRRIWMLRRQIQSWAPDIVVSFCDSSNILTLMACPPQIPVVISERSDPRKQKLSRLWELMRRRSYPKCKVCVAQTNEVGEYLVERSLVPSDKMVIIPSGIKIPQLNTFEDPGRLQQDANKILIYVGRLSREKRVDRLLQAWAELRNHHDEWRLRIVGDGLEREQLQEQAIQLGISDSVQWNCWSDHVWNELAKSHAYCLVSEYEGFPQSMLEAMASGLPVAVLDCSPAIRQTISDGVNGLVIPLAKDIPAVLDRLLTDESLRVRLGQMASVRANEFEWSAIAPQWLIAIRSACEA